MINNKTIRKIFRYLFNVIFILSRCFYKPLKFLFKPIVCLHPRIHNFAITLIGAIKELIKPPEIHTEIINAIEPEIPPETIPETEAEVSPVTIQDKEIEDKIPEWLIEEWKAIHEIEPQLFPGNIPIYHRPPSTIAEPYLEFCKLYGDNISHVFLIPWIERGGADIVTINYIQALLNYNLSTGITVISTSNAESPWKEKLPKKVRFIEFGILYSHLSADEQEKLLTRILLQMAPKVIHNINSDLGYRIFVKYGKALKEITNLYVTLFCADITKEGKDAGYAFWYLLECFDYLKAVAIDNRSFLEKLVKIYAFDEQKMHLHYQPIQIDKKREHSDRIIEKEYINIVWAGRIDRQKRPDILIKIARASMELPFRFHVYGISVLDQDIFTKELTELENVTYYGIFNELSSLPIDAYDLFLYTSQWDGLPTILLDAIILKLPIIASNVGGVSELIISEKTGFLIEPYDDIDKYVECLTKIYNDRSSLSQIVDNAFELVSKRHSWVSFLENLKKFPGYIV